MQTLTSITITGDPLLQSPELRYLPPALLLELSKVSGAAAGPSGDAAAAVEVQSVANRAAADMLILAAAPPKQLALEQVQVRHGSPMQGGVQNEFLCCAC
jgi:hypothetical protein